jgi:hypothetical protein
MKTSAMKVQVTVQETAKVIALIITMIDSMGSWQVKKILSTVAAHYNLRVVV